MSIICSTGYGHVTLIFMYVSLFLSPPHYIPSASTPSLLPLSRVNDCLLRVNHLDCRDVDRREVAEVIRAAVAAGAPNLAILVKRRK